MRLEVLSQELKQLENLIITVETDREFVIYSGVTTAGTFLPIAIAIFLWVQMAWWVGIAGFFLGAFLLTHLFPFSYRTTVSSGKVGYFTKYGTKRSAYARSQLYHEKFLEHNIKAKKIFIG